jgi:neutral amino acid transport system ATP-binding protein
LDVKDLNPLTLRCERLHKSFDGIQALIDVNIQFPASGIIAIIGPNGAGKTTLLNILTGFLRPDIGRCYLGHYEITRLPPYRFAQLGVARTFQDLRLIRHLSVLDNILLATQGQRGEHPLRALVRFGLAEAALQNTKNAIELLGLVELDKHSQELAANLSYGQQKLLALACCLATKARIVLLDEPVAGVDPELTPRILNHLNMMRRDGKLVVFIEHDLAAVRQVATAVIVMDDGAIIAEGEPEDVLGRPEVMEAYIA